VTVPIEDDTQEVAWARELVDLSMTYQAMQVVEVAHRANLFVGLSHASTTASHLASERGLDEQTVEKLLIVCAALELVEREEGGWALSAKGRATLLPGSPYYQGHLLAHNAELTFWRDLEGRLQTDRDELTVSAEDSERSRSHRDFILAMHNLAMAGRAAEVAARVDLSGKRRLLDVGGGPGTYTIALCQRYPMLEGVIFDRPETLSITREVIEQFGMDGRIQTRIGDWAEDEFGHGNDAVLMSNIMHGYGSQAEMKLTKAYRSMHPSGVIILQDFLLNAEKTGPLKPALFNLRIGAFSVDELMERVAAAGFCQVQAHELPTGMGTTLVTALK
jgi:predicted O-methyltransferase YrrM